MAFDTFSFTLVYEWLFGRQVGPFARFFFYFLRHFFCFIPRGGPENLAEGGSKSGWEHFPDSILSVA